MSNTYCRFCDISVKGLYINCPKCGKNLLRSNEEPITPEPYELVNDSDNIMTSMTTNNQQVEELRKSIESTIKLHEMTFVNDGLTRYGWDNTVIDNLLDLFTIQLSLKDKQHARELELARIEAKIEERKMCHLPIQDHSKCPIRHQKHECIGYMNAESDLENENDIRLSELNKQKELLCKEQ